MANNYRIGAGSRLNDEIKAIEDLFSRSQQYRKSETYKQLLDFICKLPRLAPFNAFLVFTQHQGARYVATPAQWRNLGRSVNDEARPLVIMVPFGPVAFVYELNETDGRPLPDRLLNPFAVKGKVSNDIYAWTIRNAYNLKVPIKFVDYSGGLGGKATRKNNKFSIFIRKDIDNSSQYSIIVHELAHVLCGHLGSILCHKDRRPYWPKPRYLEESTEELEAESIAYLVCRRLGIETESEKYFTGYTESDKSIPAFDFGKVLEVSGFIERMGREKVNLPLIPKKKISNAP